MDVFFQSHFWHFSGDMQWLKRVTSTSISLSFSLLLFSQFLLFHSLSCKVLTELVCLYFHYICLSLTESVGLPACLYICLSMSASQARSYTCDIKHKKQTQIYKRIRPFDSLLRVTDILIGRQNR